MLFYLFELDVDGTVELVFGSEVSLDHGHLVPEEHIRDLDI